MLLKATSGSFTMGKDLSKYVQRIRKVALTAHSESKLEGEVNQILKDCLAEFNIEFDPFVNESLSTLGLSQVDSGRPDGVFGHIVYDYKAPGLLSTHSQLISAKSQLENYLNTATQGGHSIHPEECKKWFGYIIDGYSLFYCHSDGTGWIWSSRIEISEHSLLFLVHIYRSLGRKPLSAPLLSYALGKNSEVAREVIRVFCGHLAKPKHKTNMLFREWKRLFEQVSTYALGQIPSLKLWATEIGVATKDASQILFAMHTYYSIVVKLLTFELLSASSDTTTSLCEAIAVAPSSDDLRAILEDLENSESYKRYRISNFLEGDFFSWYISEDSKQLFQAIRKLALEFLDFEPTSSLLLPGMKKDLLKEFYSSLVDEQIRHDLGEYYTPDWLAQYVLDQAGYTGDPAKPVLDPACGSGTFLVESINRVRAYCSQIGMSRLDTLNAILNSVKGLDLNPLAVISSRANYILSIYDLAFDLGHDIEIPVYLADSINVPVEKKDDKGEPYLAYSLDTEVEDFIMEIPLSLVKSQILGQVLLICEDVIADGKQCDTFIRRLRNNTSISPYLNDSVLARLEAFFNRIYSLEERDWDKIWCRIIKNNFSPRGFAPFSFIVGNPPWVRWSRLPETYRNRVKDFCKYYGLVSGRGYSGGIESDISTVITFSAADNWLSDDGIIAFLITWTVFKTASARGFRLGYLPGSKALRILQIDDLTSLRPFADAINETSVYVAKKMSSHKQAEFTSVPCNIWKPNKGCSLIPPSSTIQDVNLSVSIKRGLASPVAEWGTPLFTGSESNYQQSSFLKGNSSYLDYAHRGTVSDCARVYWVKVEKYAPETNRALIRTLTEDELPQARVIDPVNGAWIEADLLYPLIRGRDLGRYSFSTKEWYQIIPNKHYETTLDEESFADHYPLTYSYFKNYEDLLLARSSYRRYQKHLPFYVIYCVGDYTFMPYKVAWMEQQDPRNFKATVISLQPSSILPNKLLVPDHKLYFASLSSESEAYYLCGFLNARPVRIWLGGFLLGKQIATTIFEYMQVPKFDPTNSIHRRISEIAQNAHGDRVMSYSNVELRDDLETELSNLVMQIASP